MEETADAAFCLGTLPYFTGFYQRGGSSSGPSQDFISTIEEKKSYTIKDLDIEDHLPASRRTYTYTYLVATTLKIARLVFCRIQWENVHVSKHI